MSEVLEETISTIRNGIIEPRVTVVGVGGAGSNIVNALRAHIDGVETVAINTDVQHLFSLDTDKKILIGRSVTKGLGARYPEVGAYAAESSRLEIEAALQSDVTVIVAGLGGGTGTGALPVITELAKDRSITIAIAIMPFSHEGESRKKVAEECLRDLRLILSSVMVLENDSLLKFSDMVISEALLEIPTNLIANIIRGIIEQVSMSFLTTLDEELTEMLGESLEDEICLSIPQDSQSERVAPVQFDRSGFIETKTML